MGALLLLGQLLTLSNTLTPMIANLLIQLRGENPGLTDDEIMAKAMAAALETKKITEEDMKNNP